LNSAAILNYHAWHNFLIFVQPKSKTNGIIFATYLIGLKAATASRPNPIFFKIILFNRLLPFRDGPNFNLFTD
jgi:hypothetical protein